MRFLRRSEPPGLYHDKQDPEVLAQMRKRIQEHNQSVLLATESKLRRLPLYFSRQLLADPIPLPELWCNSDNPKDAKRGRFSLMFLTAEPSNTGMIEAKLAITDNQKGKPAAIRSWEFRPFGEGERQYIRVTSGLDTTIGYEGNGYGTALMRLGDVVTESVRRAIVAHPELAISGAAAKYPWLAIVADSAVTATYDRPDLPPRPDVPTNRKNWTRDISLRYLSGFTTDKNKIEQNLGFVPQDKEYRYGDLFKLYK